ncbi:MAG: hypothetical protein KBT68_02620, partial [bacterium]|nr:hypothetical protein [Candidatus Colisoma equi]
PPPPPPPRGARALPPGRRGPAGPPPTAGLDDVGELGEMRVEKTLRVLESTDIAVWIGSGFDKWRSRFNVPVIEYRRGDSVEELKKKIAAVKIEENAPGLLDGLVKKGDRVLCVCPIDESAPKGRLILPQVQVIRECLDRHVTVTVCQPGEVEGLKFKVQGLKSEFPFDLVVTDSQAFGSVNQTIRQSNNRTIRLTSFSILFARQKGDLGEYAKGLKAIANLKDGDTVLIAEGCTHHRQCNDIGTVKIPKALEKLSGRKLKFAFASGGAFAVSAPVAPRIAPASELASLGGYGGGDGTVRLVVHCGGCMLTRREMLRRIALAKEAGVPIVNYGLVLAQASGIDIGGLISPELTAIS